MEQMLFNWSFGLGMTLLGWFGKTIWDANKELRTDLSKLREELPDKYVQKPDMEKRFDKLDAALERIYEKLDAKQDK